MMGKCPPVLIQVIQVIIQATQSSCVSCPLLPSHDWNTRLDYHHHLDEDDDDE